MSTRENIRLIARTPLRFRSFNVIDWRVYLQTKGYLLVLFMSILTEHSKSNK